MRDLEARVLFQGICPAHLKAACTKDCIRFADPGGAEVTRFITDFSRLESRDTVGSVVPALTAYFSTLKSSSRGQCRLRCSSLYRRLL